MKTTLLIICCLTARVFVSAQTSVYSNDIIYTTNSNDTIFISGSLINNTTATLLNTNGNIYVKQHVENNQTGMIAGSGKLWFTGTAQQIITGTAEMRTHTWIVDNSAGVLLQNRIGTGNGTSGNLEFVNGKITSGTALQDVLFYPGSNYTGYTDAAHIIGYCSKRGSTDFTYPIGDGTYKADLDISSLTSETQFQCKYFGTGYGVYSAITPLVSVFDKEYWTLDRVSGSSAAEITLKWNDSRKVLNHVVPAGLRVGHYVTGTGWISEGGTGSGNTATGTVKSILVNSFSPFTFASESSVLPVKLSSFKTAAEADCSVRISWVSEDESDVKEYQLQRSNDARNWRTFKTVAVNNNGSYINSYTVKDEQNEKLSWYYRLKVIEQNNHVVYSGISRATTSCDQKQIQVYPTVTRNAVWVTNNLQQQISVTVVDLNGRILSRFNAVNAQNFQINLSAYASGTYYIQVQRGVKSESFKVVKTN